MRPLRVIHLGRRAYGPTLELQHRLLAQTIADPQAPEHLLLVEHDPPTVTLGRSAKAQHILAGADQLVEAGIELHEIRRGGDVTYHGPGQLVAYPILRLDAMGRDIHRYIRRLEGSVIDTLAAFGLTGVRVPGRTGVWVGDAKVAAIGVAARRWVSYHGLALNVDPNLDHFRLIVPCGIADKPVTSMARLSGGPVDASLVGTRLVQCIAEQFDLAPRECAPDEL